jgi:transposase, IS30 family
VVAVAGLALWEREEISRGLAAGESLRGIARTRLPGRDPSTVSREVARHGGRGRYRAERALRAAAIGRRRPKPRRLVVEVELAALVLARLLRRWSPRQIAAGLAAEFPDRPELQVSHETIYRSLFVQGRGELRRELARCLRTGRVRRRARRRPENTGQLRDMVMISERPAEAADRAVPGHWEGDLLIGGDCRSAVGTLVERTTRYVLLLHLPDGRDAVGVERAMRQAISTLPNELRRSITWDQGKEMAHHAQFTISTGIQVYFCDPHKPWQRGSNENTVSVVGDPVGLIDQAGVGSAG